MGKPASNPANADPRGADRLATGPTGGRTPTGPPRPLRRMLIYRHSVVVRITHWVNVVCLTVLLMSGLQIFNAHPALYLGNLSDFSHPLLSMSAVQPEGGPGRGVTTVFGHSLIPPDCSACHRTPRATPWSAGFRSGPPCPVSNRWRRAAFGTSSSPGCSS